MPQTNRRSVVIDTARGPHARLGGVPVGAVRLNDAFWSERRRSNREVTLPSQFRLLEETGRIDNFRRAAGDRPDLLYQGIYFNDSDVYKWLEACAWTVAGEPDEQIAGLMDRVIDAIAAAQQPDGYLNTYFMFERAAERWTNFDAHEMYCAGHLIQAAVAHYRATGSYRLLDVATRLADYLDRTFGPADQGKREYADGHEEVEMALVELYRVTDERRYLDLANFFVAVRGRGLLKHPKVHFNSAYYQDHVPFNELDEMIGHAVRAVYYACGAADLCAEIDDPAMRTALDRLWDNMTTRRMYVSGGVGSRYEGEAFGSDYELPNERAYTETCAAIGSVMWNQRMLALEADARYADLLELTLYNAVLAGISLDGQAYFYQNPLADGGNHRRKPWFGTACCPPNIARLLAALPGYFYSTSNGGVWVHLYAENSAEITLPDGQQVRLEQQTRYPWHGDIDLRVNADAEFSLYLRLPGWCEGGIELSVNDEPFGSELKPGSYVELRRRWLPGDRVRLHLPMPVRTVQSHPFISENAGQIALMRGPLLYCLEAADHPDTDIRALSFSPNVEPQIEEQPDLLGGVVVLRGTTRLLQPDPSWQGTLYRNTKAALQAKPDKQAPFTAIPYYAWANRTPGRMQVWLRSEPA